MLPTPKIPPFLLREHDALSIYCYLLQATEREPMRVIKDGRVKEIGPFECGDNVDIIASAVGMTAEAILTELDLLQEVGLLHVDKVAGVIRLTQVSTTTARVVVSLPESDSQQTEACTLEAFSQDYLEHVAVSFSKKTQENAKRVLTFFSEFLGEKPMTSLTAEDLEHYKAARKGHVRDTTINIDIRTIKAAFAVAAQWKRVPNNPFANVKQIRTCQQTAKGLTRVDFGRLIVSIKEKWFRDLVTFAALTGLRRGEVLNLRWADFDEGTSTIVIESSAEYRVKGGKQRTLPLNSQARTIIDALPRTSEWIFSTNKGLPYNGDYVRKKFKRCVRRAELPDHLHFHSLRHTFGKWAADASVLPHALKQMMGHSSIKTTEMYIGADQHLMAMEIRKVMIPTSAPALRSA